MHSEMMANVTVSLQPASTLHLHRALPQVATNSIINDETKL